MDVIEQFIKPRIRIRTNSLLRGADKTLEVSEVLTLKKLADYGQTQGGEGEFNLAEVSEDLIRLVHSRYGPSGLFQLVALAMAHNRDEFRHFFELVTGEFLLRALVEESEGPELVCDNDRLKASSKIKKLATNVFQPSLSRKLYRAGRHHGSLVYGLGGPRILVSHPFQGVTEDVYDLYSNTVDVVTSLQLRGYQGTFHFLDLMPGLNFEVEGIPAWLVWFSVIAIHSDLVLYVKEYEGDFGPAQRLEMEFTPDSVQKTMVEIPHAELTWAKKPQMPEGALRMYVGEDGEMMTEEAWYHMEAEHALPFIDNYTSAGLPRDRLIRIDEAGDITEYPLDYSVYS